MLSALMRAPVSTLLAAPANQRRKPMQSSERSVSLWKDTVEPLSFPALSADASADVCVVGAGIAGLTTAYLLAREGRSVIVVDRLALAGGESGQTSAHLTSEIDDFYSEIEKLHGRS